MVLTGRALEEGLDWSVTASTDSPGGGGRRPPPSGGFANACLANAAFLHGKGSQSADCSSLADRGLYAPWALSADPLSVAHSPFRLRKCAPLRGGPAPPSPARRCVATAPAGAGAGTTWLPPS